MSVADDTVDEVMLECELDAAPEKVWRALTVPELADSWLNLADGEDGATYEVVEALPHSRVRYAWRDGSRGPRESTVTIDLSPLPDGGTRFRLRHTIATAGMMGAANGNLPPTLSRAA